MVLLRLSTHEAGKEGSILLVTKDLDESLELIDRIAAMCWKGFMNVLDRCETRKELVKLLMVGVQEN